MNSLRRMKIRKWRRRKLRIIDGFINCSRISHAEPELLHVYGAQESFPRNQFRQPM